MPWVGAWHVPITQGCNHPSMVLGGRVHRGRRAGHLWAKECVTAAIWPRPPRLPVEWKPETILAPLPVPPGAVGWLGCQNETK